MKFCFISREYVGSVRSGGIKTYLETVVSTLLSGGHEVTIICANDNDYRDEEKNGANIVRLPCYDYYRTNKLSEKILSKIRSIIFFHLYRIFVAFAFLYENYKTDFDVIEIPDYGAEGKFIFYFKKWIRGCIVIRLHGSSFMKVPGDAVTEKVSLIDRITIYNEKKCIQSATLISSPSIFMKNFLLDSLPSVNEAKIIILHNPIYEKFLSLSKMLNEKEIDKEKVNIGYIGTISELKGVRLLIDSIIDINDSNSDCSFNLELAGRMTRNVQNYINKVNSININYVGVLNRDEVIDFYSRVDLIVIPSYREPFGLVALEAMSTNGLVIASNAGALSEIVIDGENGFSFESGSVSSLVENLRKIQTYPPSSLSEIRRSAKKSVELYSPKRYLDKLVSSVSPFTNK